MANKNNIERNNRTKPTREEIIEKKVSMAKERGARIIVLNSPLGNIMFNVLRQFDQAYSNLKGKLGEPGGITFEEGSEIMEKAGKITQEFSELTKELSKKVKFRYYTPEELKSFSNTEKPSSAKVEKNETAAKEAVEA